ncbi:MAG: NAD(P)-binding domain-containing protein [Actinobacteria bacterium]|nr:NAD(P)-binding domain-containing protein [Actinomycetota bacterium]
MPEVVVVGAGPIGLEVALRLMADGREVLVLDQGPIGNTIRTTFPPDTRFFSSPERIAIAGRVIPSADQEKTRGEDYLAYLRAVAESSEVPVRTYTRCLDVEGEAGDLRVKVSRTDDASREELLSATAVVLAVGGTHRSRRLGVPGEDLGFVHSRLRDPGDYYGRRVLVVGGRNSAAESALRLYRAGARVAISYRGPHLHDRVKFWIRPEVEGLLEEGRIARFMPSVVERVLPGRVELSSPEGERQVQVDEVLLQIGFEQDSALFRRLGIPVLGPDRVPEYDHETMRTSRPGVFVAGTATAGTQSGFRVFIENCHQHAERIAAALAGREPPEPVAARPLPEV